MSNKIITGKFCFLQIFYHDMFESLRKRKEVLRKNQIQGEWVLYFSLSSSLSKYLRKKISSRNFFLMFNCLVDLIFTNITDNDNKWKINIVHNYSCTKHALSNIDKLEASTTWRAYEWQIKKQQYWRQKEDIKISDMTWEYRDSCKTVFESAFDAHPLHCYI